MNQSISLTLVSTNQSEMSVPKSKDPAFFNECKKKLLKCVGEQKANEYLEFFRKDKKDRSVVDDVILDLHQKGLKQRYISRLLGTGVSRFNRVINGLEPILSKPWKVTEDEIRFMHEDMINWPSDRKRKLNKVYEGYVERAKSKGQRVFAYSTWIKYRQHEQGMFIVIVYS